MNFLKVINSHLPIDFLSVTSNFGSMVDLKFARDDGSEYGIFVTSSARYIFANKLKNFSSNSGNIERLFAVSLKKQKLLSVNVHNCSIVLKFSNQGMLEIFCESQDLIGDDIVAFFSFHRNPIGYSVEGGFNEDE